MSYVTLAFPNQTSGVLGRSTVVAGLLFDAATAEDVQLSSDITQHEVEDGSPISDHIRHQPDVLTVSGKIGDASLAILPSASDILSGAISSIASVIGGSSWKNNTLTNPFGSSMSDADVDGARQALKSAKRLPSAGRSRLIQAVATLYAARDARMPVDVVTGMAFYDNYYIRSIGFSRGNEEGGGMLNVTVTLQTVRIVATETGTLVYPNQPNSESNKTSQRNSKAKNKGRATQKAASSSTEEAVVAVMTRG